VNDEQYAMDVLEMFDGLQRAVNRAGGVQLTLERLRKMTVEEMILLLAPNKIQFHFAGPE
jgi:hypothetical protein